MAHEHSEAARHLIEGVQAVFFYVADMQRALTFYGDLLNLPVTERGSNWSALNAGGIRLGLHWTGGKSVGYTAQDDRVRPGAVVSFRVSDTAASVERLRAAGEEVGKITDESYGLLAHVEDPDGNRLRLIEVKR